MTERQWGFVDKGDNFLIRTQRTPRGWINTHSSGFGEMEYHTTCSNICHGLSLVRNSEQQVMLTKNPEFEKGEKTIYLRDEDAGHVWSIGGYPVKSDVQDIRCLFTAEKTEISSVYKGIFAQERFFVPRHKTFEIWTVTLTNKSDTSRKISLFPYVALDLEPRFGFPHEYIGANKSYSFHKEMNGMFAENKHPFAHQELFRAFCVSSEPVLTCYGDAEWLTHPNCSFGAPKIMDGWTPEGYQEGASWQICFFMQNTVTLKAGETKVINFSFGHAVSVEAATEVTKLMKRNDEIEALLDKVKEHQEMMRNYITVNTGHFRTDTIFNFWLKKQMESWHMFSKGFRDNIQINGTLVMVDPDGACNDILRMLTRQYESGLVPRWTRPIDRSRKDGDGPSWLIYEVPLAIKETGDFSFLQKKVPYLTDEDKPTTYTETVWNHLVRAMRWLATNVGPQGIALVFYADWNEDLITLSKFGPHAQSTMIAGTYCAGLLEMAELARQIGDTEIEHEAMRHYATMKENLNKNCWDGNWYIRAFAGDGYRLGSKDNKEGQVWAETQVWMILGKIPDETRLKKIQKVMDSRLIHPLGLRSVDPSYSIYDKYVSRVAMHPAGAGLNGIYCNIGANHVVGECMAGRNEEAWKLFNTFIPDNENNPTEQSRGEPYSITNSFRLNAPYYGRYGQSWRTGTSGWVFRALIEFILGVRRDYKGLMIDPCLPAEIRNASVNRKFRGSEYFIEIDNNAGRCKHAKEILVNGKKIDGNILPITKTPAKYEVKVIV